MIHPFKVFCFLSYLFLLFSCKEEKKKIEVSDFSNYNTVEIPMLEAKMYLPHHYRSATLKEFQEHLLAEFGDQLSPRQKREILKDERESNSSQFFIDTIETANNIEIYKIPYTPFNRRDASYFLGGVVESLKRETWLSKDEFELLDTKFFAMKRAKIAKVKYRHYNDSGEGFSTRYLITIDDKATFILNVNNITNNDYEHLIKKLMFYK